MRRTYSYLDSPKWWLENTFAGTRIGRVLFEPMARVMEESLKHAPKAFEKWPPPRLEEALEALKIPEWKVIEF